MLTTLKGWDHERYMFVVYLDQHLGAAHSKCWLKYAFLTFCAKKLKKEEQEMISLQEMAEF